MKTDERIIKYLENELSQKDRDSFEADLNNSVELRDEFDKYLQVKAKTDELKKLKLNFLYLNTLIPGFRKKFDAPKSSSVKKNLGYAFGIMLVFILSILILKNFYSSGGGSSDIQKFTETLNENQQYELLAELNGESEIYNLMLENLSEYRLTIFDSENLDIKVEVAEAFDIDYNDLIVNLNQNEVDEIYQEILNRKF